MPTTYRFYWGVEPEEVIGELISSTHHLFADSLVARMEELGWSEHETLTLASLIEAEAGVAVERPRISAVFHNRLQRGMRLQTDPTVIYGLGDNFDGNLTREHLRTETPYNTYIHKGLPPTPIAMPGGDAIHAALHPADTTALYFVARGDGSHEFSSTLEAHNRAVVQYQLSGKKTTQSAVPNTERN